jgi:hypothetical protein
MLVGDGPSVLTLAIGVVLIAWLIWVAMTVGDPRAPVVQAVMAWIAGMCLLDAFYLSLLNQPVAAGAALALFLLTRMGHRRILGS